MKTRIVLMLLVSVIFILIAAQCSSSAPTSAPQSPANTQSSTGSTLDGKALLQDRCTTCHSLQRSVSRGGNASQWKSVVDNMIRQGAQLTKDEETALVSYLAQTYP